MSHKYIEVRNRASFSIMAGNSLSSLKVVEPMSELHLKADCDAIYLGPKNDQFLAVVRNAEFSKYVSFTYKMDNGQTKITCGNIVLHHTFIKNPLLFGPDHKLDSDILGSNMQKDFMSKLNNIHDLLLMVLNKIDRMEGKIKHLSESLDEVKTNQSNIMLESKDNFESFQHVENSLLQIKTMIGHSESDKHGTNQKKKADFGQAELDSLGMSSNATEQADTSETNPYSDTNDNTNNQ